MLGYIGIDRKKFRDQKKFESKVEDAHNWGIFVHLGPWTCVLVRLYLSNYLS